MIYVNAHNILKVISLFHLLYASMNYPFLSFNLQTKRLMYTNL